MKNLKAKLNKQGGFTLIEMLIVVAIIAILVAVSVPLINSSLERARETTDAANERSFKAVLLIAYANGKFDTSTDGVVGAPANFSANTVYAYDAANGAIVTASKAPATGYGKSTALNIVDSTVRKGQILYGMVDGDTGTVYMLWKAKGTTTVDNIKDSKNATLIYTKMVAEKADP